MPEMLLGVLTVFSFKLQTAGMTGTYKDERCKNKTRKKDSAVERPQGGCRDDTPGCHPLPQWAGDPRLASNQETTVKVAGRPSRAPAPQVPARSPSACTPITIPAAPCRSPASPQRLSHAPYTPAWLSHDHTYVYVSSYVKWGQQEFPHSVDTRIK